MGQWALNVLAVVGALFSIWNGVVQVRDRFGHYRWPTIERKTKKLIAKIRADEFAPDVVVGLGRSGGVVGGMVAGNLGVLPVSTVDRRYDRVSGSRTVRVINLPRREDIEGRKILLVDAVPHGGLTLRTVKAALLELAPAELKTASLVIEPAIMEEPDFYVTRVGQVRRVPWRWSDEYREDFLAPSNRG